MPAALIPTGLVPAAVIAVAAIEPHRAAPAAIARAADPGDPKLAMAPLADDAAGTAAAVDDIAAATAPLGLGEGRKGRDRGGSRKRNQKRSLHVWSPEDGLGKQ